MQTASLTGFLRTILIILLVWYGVKVLMRIFAPYLANYASKKMQERFGGQFQHQQHQAADRNRAKEGETVIDKMPDRPQSSKKKIGEYIDYEEID
ncbi:MAG TPA: DUF4834 family protein [Gelidibacter sp.]|uniref:DUF4834 family protein n=1 Tax=Gelidibacter sp. TaxID=2018083 RepID=UPI002BEB73D6|nr:DUF4834 family protein [Gelidibacter sp.]HXJ98631.1 DUF4834 family protein [Gelidibacter sp.]